MIYTIDATNKKIGRLASEIALILQGKKNPKYEPRLEGEDGVIIKNIDKIEISAAKKKQKTYFRHTTQIGHLKKQTLKEVLEKKGAAEVLRRSVKGMLPKNKLLIKRMKKLIIE
ncbi:50S ribosomal protein L13 [Candidatus Wolfebacteria bacterium]|nr:50S ribosomal protein L13 [Candidatus Wolfebacteria bacterium]